MRTNPDTKSYQPVNHDSATGAIQTTLRRDTHEIALVPNLVSSSWTAPARLKDSWSSAGTLARGALDEKNSRATAVAIAREATLCAYCLSGGIRLLAAKMASR